MPRAVIEGRRAGGLLSSMSRGVVLPLPVQKVKQLSRALDEAVVVVVDVEALEDGRGGRRGVANVGRWSV